jgi:hypothetical protein
MTKIEEILRELERQRFYGAVEVKFEAGRVVLVRKTETLKPAPEDYRDNRGKIHENIR